MDLRSRRVVGGVLAAAVFAAGTLAWAQQHHGRGGGRASGGTAASGAQAQPQRMIAIPVVEASAALQQQRVFLFTPPAGQSAFGLGMLGEGHRVWALLPSCRRPNPDDPRDPCPVGRLAMEVVTGNGSVATGEPQSVDGNPDSRRVQSFVVPASVEQLRIKMLRHDNTVRYDVVVDAPQLGNLPAPEGSAHGPDAFSFEMAQYPAR